MIYAKTYKQDNRVLGETLEEHTKNLLKEYENLKALYGGTLEKIGFTDDLWNLLYLACLFHDLGKVSSPFQEKIKRYLEGGPALNSNNKEIPHNYLSPAFLKSLKNIEQSNLILLFYIIAFHHNRPLEFNEAYLQEMIAKDLSNKITELKWLEDFDIKIEELWNNYYHYLDENINSYQSIKRDKRYILLKGFLHRLDHSASAHLPVEESKISNPEDKLIMYLRSKPYFTGLKPFQEKARYLRDKNILLTASTGMGKTEFAINWIGDDKAFYTLPLRVSVNAMYERFSSIFSGDNIGLLHSDSLLYGIEELENKEKSGFKDEDFSIEEHIHRVNVTRQFSMPITITTADQLFTAVFKWKGYEKIYATLAYSKVIIDEPQSYSADILAFIIKALQEIAEFGGKFCIMSATVHPFIERYIGKYCEILDPVYNQEKKHKIKLERYSIEDLIPDIVRAYKSGKKVLVIANTIKKSQELYSEFKTLGNVNLLHSGFIQDVRRSKEKNIEMDYKKDEPVIWITTQIVEVSLDIDYDILFTEISTADAIIQRMGRIYRRPKRIIREKDEPNIVIAIEKPSDKFYIYDEEIVGFTKEALEEFNYKIISEEQKQELISQVFDLEKIKNTKFYRKFCQVFNLLDSGFETDNREEAQRLFRSIANLTVIPEPVYFKNSGEITECITKISSKALPLRERLRYIKLLNDFTVSIPIYKAKGKEPIPIDQKRGIYLLKIRYDENLGVIFDKNLEEFSNIIG